MSLNSGSEELLPCERDSARTCDCVPWRRWRWAVGDGSRAWSETTPGVFQYRRTGLLVCSVQFFIRSLLAVDRRSRARERKITSSRSPFT